MGLTNKFIFLIILVFFLNSTPVFSEDSFIASGQQTIDACRCATKEVPITVQNLIATEHTTLIIENKSTDRFKTAGKTIGYYSLRLEGEAAQWATIFPAELGVETGESQTANIIIIPPCDNSGNYDLTTYVESQSREIQEIKHSIHVKECSNSRISMPYTHVTTCPCNMLTFNFTLTNNGPFTETYLLDVDKFGEYATVFPTTAIVKSGKSLKGYLQFEFPCDVHGQKELKLVSRAMVSGESTKMPLRLDIRPCYNFSITSQDDPISCRDTGKKTLQINISNDVRIKNAYKIKVTDKEKRLIDYEDTIQIDSFGNASVNVSYDTSDNGNYSAVIDIVSGYGNLRASKQLNITVEECYRPSVESLDETEEFCCEDSKTSTFRIRNTGKREADYLVWAEFIQEGNAANKAISITTDANVISLKPSESRNVSAFIKAQCDELNSSIGQGIKLYAVSKDYPAINDSEGPDYNILSSRDCHRIGIAGKKEISMFYEYQKYDFRIINSGLKTETVNLSYPGLSWIKISPEVFYLNPQEERDFMLEIFPNRSMVETGRYDMQVIMHTDSGIKYYDTIVVNIKENPFYIALQFAKKAYEYADALLDSILAFIGSSWSNTIDYCFSPVEDRACKNESILEIAKFQKYLKSNNLTQDNRFHVLDEDSTFRLNLSKLFYDPDNDVLDYESHEADNLSIIIEGEFAVVFPDNNFCGIRNTEFSAFDGKGGTTNSSKITFVVKNMQEPSRTGKMLYGIADFFREAFGFMRAYATYFIIGILLLIIIISMLTFFSRPPSSEPTVRRIRFNDTGSTKNAAAKKEESGKGKVKKKKKKKKTTKSKKKR